MSRRRHPIHLFLITVGRAKQAARLSSDPDDPKVALRMTAR